MRPLLISNFSARVSTNRVAPPSSANGMVVTTLDVARNHLGLDTQLGGTPAQQLVVFVGWGLPGRDIQALFGLLEKRCQGIGVVVG